MADEPQDGNGPGWRHRAVSKSLSAARTRAEQRVQGLLDAAFELIDERGTTQFTIQEVVDHSKQSLRGFYQYFDSKDELLFALLEEVIRESLKDLQSAVDSETKPLGRLRAFTIVFTVVRSARRVASAAPTTASRSQILDAARSGLSAWPYGGADLADADGYDQGRGRLAPGDQ
jgi:AcrR family transcriptional regulator